VAFRGLHDLDERLVEGAAAQRDQHSFRGVEDSRAGAARVGRPV